MISRASHRVAADAFGSVLRGIPLSRLTRHRGRQQRRIAGGLRSAFPGSRVVVAGRRPRSGRGGLSVVRRGFVFRGTRVGGGEDDFHSLMVVSEALRGERDGEAARVGVVFRFENDGKHAAAFAATPPQERDCVIQHARLRMNFGRVLPDAEGPLDLPQVSAVPWGRMEARDAPWFADGVGGPPVDTSVPVYAFAYATPQGKVGLTVRSWHDGMPVEERILVDQETYARILLDNEHFGRAFADSANQPEALDLPASPAVVLVTPYAAMSGVAEAVSRALHGHGYVYGPTGQVTVAPRFGVHQIVVDKPFAMY